MGLQKLKCEIQTSLESKWSRFSISTPTKQSDDSGRDERTLACLHFWTRVHPVGEYASHCGADSGADLAVRQRRIDFYQFWLVGQFIDQYGIERSYSEAVYDRCIGFAGMQFSADSSSARGRTPPTSTPIADINQTSPRPLLYAVLRLFSTRRLRNRRQSLSALHDCVCHWTYRAGPIAPGRSGRTLIALAVTLLVRAFQSGDVFDGNTAATRGAGHGKSGQSRSFHKGGLFTASSSLRHGDIFKPNTILAPLALQRYALAGNDSRLVIELALA